MKYRELETHQGEVLMEQFSLWVSSVLAYGGVAFWWVLGVAFDNWLVTTIVILVVALVITMQTLKEYMLYK